ncbi:hypothetical protein [Nocardioides sp.]|uniref:hypothetical protein n=1 Tax=Nocardioides sp. TaxID=35761 RepID=UPI002ED37FB6
MSITIRRILTTAAAAGILSLACAGPAAAEHEPGTGPRTVTREGLVDDDDLVYFRAGLGALFGIALTGAAAGGIHRHRQSGSGGGPSRELGDFETTSRAGLA